MVRGTKKGSIIRALGWSAGAFAAAAFVATGAFAEPPSHSVTRPPRVFIQRPHAPHAVHKPHPVLNPHTTDHPPQIVHNIAPALSQTVVHVHKNVHVQPIVRGPHAHGTTTIIKQQIDHVKTQKKITK
jgi:hypothetical protein